MHTRYGNKKDICQEGTAISCIVNYYETKKEPFINSPFPVPAIDKSYK